MPTPEYELFAIRYATRKATRSEHFIGADPHEGPMDMDYFIWVAKCRDRAVIIDTGFSREMARTRNREFLRCPVESLKLVGVDAAEVEDVILTHLHYDHAGNLDKFPRARFHLQESELQYATGRYMRFRRMAQAYDVSAVCRIVQLNYAQRLVLHTGDAQVVEGIRLHLTGGHTAGLQFVTVQTRRGPVIVASDATHFYENFDRDHPFTIAFHVGEMHESFERLRRCGGRSHLIPGHDPRVMHLYPNSDAALRGIVARLDSEPISNAEQDP